MSRVVQLINMDWLRYFLLFSLGMFCCRCSPETPQVKFSYSGFQVINVIGEKARDLFQKLFDQGDIEEWGGNSTHFDVFVPKDKVDEIKTVLNDNKIQFNVKIEDVQRAIDTENPPVEEEDEFEGRKGHRMTFNFYHRLADIYGYLDYLAQTYPNFVSVSSMGKSVEGRDIKFIKISSGNPNAKKFWIEGGIHAREWISPATTSYIVSELVENRNKHLQEVDGIDFYVVPVLNPDGYEYTHEGERLWRKNRSKHHFYCYGTDLNRNWGFHWGGKGTSNQNCRDIYRGRGPFSEPETRAASNFILNNAQNMKAFISFHSYGQYILIPYGYDQNTLPPDFQELYTGALKMARAMRSIAGTHYQAGNSANLLYAASGGADDWAKGAAHIKYSYTIELRDQGTYGFTLPASQILDTAKEGLAAVKTLSSLVKQTN
ncbi:carboxypeptidase B-like [Cimex lectularius]|uniref:Peptidase M14 domain-containing protein n=1 Tax=Cimex lectularius TaxID=79782 RepID=A0A8I6S1F9_CIMLE|nr:carboxypeptidase B-like [Cimex lectularius]